MNVYLNYNEWWQWYPTDEGGYPGQKVTFDGPNRLIRINEGVTSINVKKDIYSGWKEWSIQRENLRFAVAVSSLGGDPINFEVSVGDTYFLENGWRIQPYPTGNGYIVDVVGNIYTREPGENPVNPTDNVSVLLTRSNITETALAGGEVTATRLEEIWKILGLDSLNPQIVRDTSITVGNITLTITNDEVQETTTVVRT